MRIRWTRPALEDLEAIGDHMAAEVGSAIAGRQVNLVLDAVDRLAIHPHSGRPGRVPETRELVVTRTPFLVPYRVVSGEVQILAVFHGARLWPETFG